MLSKHSPHITSLNHITNKPIEYIPHTAKSSPIFGNNGGGHHCDIYLLEIMETN